MTCDPRVWKTTWVSLSCSYKLSCKATTVDVRGVQSVNCKKYNCSNPVLNSVDCVILRHQVLKLQCKSSRANSHYGTKFLLSLWSRLFLSVTPIHNQSSWSGVQSLWVHWSGDKKSLRNTFDLELTHSFYIFCFNIVVKFYCNVKQSKLNFSLRC